MAKVIPIPKRNVIKLLLDANHQEVLKNREDKNFLKEEYRYLYNRQNILKKQIKIVQQSSDNNIKLFDEIKNIESNKIKALPLADKREVFYSALNFLPKPPNDKITGLPLLEKEEDKLHYINNLTNQELHKHYQEQIDNLKLELKYIQKILKVIKDNQDKTIDSKLLATPTDLRIASIGTKQTLKWLDVDDNHKEKVKELLKNTTPEILQKLEDEDNPNEIISHFIGIKLTKRELRILKTLRALVDRAFKLKEILSYSHKVRINRTDFYKEYGLKPRLCGGYDDNQTKEIREILFSESGNLTKRIFFKNSKNQTVSVSAFVLKIEWDPKEKNYFDVMLDDIIFVKDKSDKYSYYYEDLQGLNRLLELMPNSNAAFDIHGYLEYSVRLNVQEFGITKIVGVNDGLSNRYQKHKKETELLIEEVLDNMVKVKTIISKWQKIIGKNETKYSLTNIRQKEISNEIVTIKNRKRKNKYN